MKRVLVIGLTLLIAAAVLPFVLYRAAPKPGQPDAQPSTAVTIDLGEPLIRPYGMISITVNGREVYRDTMRTVTAWGVSWWMNTFAYWFYYNDRPDLFHRVAGAGTVRARLSYSSGGTTATVDSSISKSWGYNSTHAWFTITASYVASADWTLRWVVLCWLDQGNTLRYFSNDTLTGITIPSGSDFAITWWFYWRDNGILTENFLKYTDVMLPHQSYYSVTVTDVNGASRPLAIDIAGSYFPYAPWSGSTSGILRISIAWGTDCSSPSRTAFKLNNQVATTPPSVSIGSRGVVFAATVQQSNICEVGLLMRYYTGGSEYTMLLLRWTSGQPLPAGTTVRIYLIPPP